MSTYVTVAVSKTDQWLGGKSGDHLDRLICVVGTAASSSVSLKDGSGGSVSVLPANVGGGVGTYVVEVNAPSQSGPWRITTGAGVTVVAVGDFTTLHHDQNYMLLTGAAGVYASTPDAAANSITGDIDLRAKVAANDWTPATKDRALIAKWSASGQFSYKFSIVVTTGLLNLSWSADGTAVISKSSTVAPTVADGATLWVRATLDVDNGAVGNTVTFYTSTDGTTWTQLGDPVVTAATTSIFDSTSPVEVGADLGGTDLYFTGKIYDAQIYQGIAGTLKAEFDPTNALPSDTSFVSPTAGETWTLNGVAAIVLTE